MATITDVNNYIDSIRSTLSSYGYKLSKNHQIGNKPLFAKELKFMLLQAYVEIAEFYLREWDDTDNNLFTIEEFEDIQQHINKISNSFHWLDLN
jgi:hypothetical protein